MSSIHFINAQIVTDAGCVMGEVMVSDGVIVEVGPRRRTRGDRATVVDLGGKFLAPGFVDVQVNGGGGVLFNDAPTVATMNIMASAHRRFGTTAMLPTLISDDLDKIGQAIEAADDAVAAGVPGILGVHIEGPFLNKAKRGIHDASKICALTDEAVALLCAARHAIIVVTLAPDVVSLAHIQRLSEAGVRICAGHTNANYDQTKAALAAGVTGVTHLFNAMPPMQSRDPGMIPAALDSAAWAGLIVDGHHVHPAMLQLAWRAKKDRRFMLVTDAMPIVGTEQDRFYLGDREILVEAGACRSVDGTLAGAAISMNDALVNATQMMGVSLAEASKMASGHPAAFLGQSAKFGSIAPAKRADFVVLSDDLKVVETWIGGVRMDD